MKQYDIAAYIWPAYTGAEPRTRMFWPEGYGEWQSVKSATAKYEGHTWPRKPLWGYVNEADPAVMEMEIKEAKRHGVNVFIYDWYWYDGRPFLENCLNDGFLKAKNCSDMQFYIMWANHDANNVWNKEISDTEAGNTVIWKGGCDADEFRKLSRRVCDQYFGLDNYYKINSCPVWMIYELSTFVKGLGGAEQAAMALNEFREYVKSKGFPGVHIQFTGRKRDVPNLSGVDGERMTTDFEVMAEKLGIDSFTHYQFVHYLNIDRDYADIAKDAKAFRSRIDETIKIPYFAHVSCGWDNNPRFKKFRPGIVKNNTPENFEAALRDAKEYADAHPENPPLITINSWNEWTETSYLQPDDLYGYGYLEAIKRVFVDEAEGEF